jgi:hypothetical protein
VFQILLNLLKSWGNLLVISIFFRIFAQDYKKHLILAYILQKDSKVKEIYLTDGETVNAKYLLFVYDNGSLVLKWCYEDIVEIQDNPTLTKVGRKMILEFGETNIFSIRQRMTFQDEMGKLDGRWEKIV